MSIEIKCRGADTLPIDAIEEFQGNLKRRSKADIEKIIKSIKEYGFSFPFFIWQGEGRNYCLDGHGRIQALCQLRQNGENLPLFPVVYIEAKDEAEAKQKLLRLNSQYGQMTVDSVLEFVGGMEMHWDDLELPSGDKMAIVGLGESESDMPDLKSGDKEPFQQMTFTLADEQAEIVKEAIRKAQEEGCESEANQNRNGNALAMICEVFIGH